MSDASFFLFPHRKLTKIIGKPSNTSLQVLKHQIYNNTTLAPSLCGSSAHGHLGIAVDTIQYMMVSSSIAWVTPKHPGDTPKLASGITSIQCKQITWQFDSDLLAYETYHGSSNALEDQLLLSVKGGFSLCIRGPYIWMHGHHSVGYALTSRFYLLYPYAQRCRA
jgi:hypothetical protein